MPYVSLWVDASDYINDLTSEEMTAELIRRKVQPPVVEKDFLATLQDWADAAPAPLAAEIRGWVFRNMPKRVIKPDVLKSGYPI